MKWLMGSVFVVATLTGPAIAGTMNEQTLPYASNQSRLEIRKDYNAAGENQASYTLAISPIGSWDSMYDRRIPSAERVRIALQKCEHRARMRCLLVYQDGHPTGNLIPKASGITYPTKFDLSAIPFVSQDVLSRIGPRYVAAKPHRAMAICAEGEIGVDAGAPTEDEAGQRALDQCRSISNGKACFLYSVDDKVVFSQTTKIY